MQPSTRTHARPSANKDELITMNNLPELALSRAFIYNFWFISLAAVEALETPLSKLN